MKLLIGLMALILLGCSHDTKHDTPKTKTHPSDTASTQLTQNQSDGKIHINLTPLQTGITPAPLADYPYPFEADSQAVKNYATSYKITPQQAQHAMTLAMASPEALSKILDQIQGHYLGHSLSDGDKLRLIVYTSEHVAPIQFDYVIADKFGEGLLLPVIIGSKTHIKKLGLDDKPQTIAPASPHSTSVTLADTQRN